MRTVFMGSPEFAVPHLRALAGAHEVALVVSQPDKPAGRGGQLAAPPVKVAAQNLGLPVIQPRSAKTGELREALVASGAELAVVVAYGKILPVAVLEALPRGCINVHASILPRHRGAAPIAHAIMAGDPVTGVSIMVMTDEMDAGDVLLVRETPLRPNDTTGTLTERLAALGGEAIGTAIDGLKAGVLHPTPQPAAGVTVAPRIEREQARLVWTRRAAELERLVRAMQPAPAAFTTLGGKVLKVHRAAIAPGAGGASPGTVVRATPAGIDVATGAGSLRLLDVQLEGKRRLEAAAFLAGHRLPPGTCLGG
jgi:methionyl-tRNA formyltransferase